MDARDIVSTNIRYYRLENAKKNIRVDYINHIANTFNITPKELFIERPLIVNAKRKRSCYKKEKITN